mgnify:CR=1 FL=1
MHLLPLPHSVFQEHSLIEQSVADILTLRAAGGGDALINRMKQLQSVGGPTNTNE